MRVKVKFGSVYFPWSGLIHTSATDTNLTNSLTSSHNGFPIDLQCAYQPYQDSNSSFRKFQG